MALEKITKVVGKAVYVAGDDIDTDRIIPARFMRCVTFDGLGEHLFHDVRFKADGGLLNHPLDRDEHKGASILVSDNNFGCGSSREHAPQAIKKFGISAVVAGGFAEIFFGNCTTLGIPCVILPDADRQKLTKAIAEDPGTEVTIDLQEQVVAFKSEKLSFTMLKSGARAALLEGQWDPIGQLLDAKADIERVESGLAYLRG